MTLSVVPQPPRRRRGTGTIEPVRGGFRPRLPGAGRARLDPCTTWEEASALLDAALLELADGAVEPVGGVTLAGFGAEWLDDRELAGVRSIDTDRSRWAVHIAGAHWATWPLASITRAHVRDWLDGLLRKRAKPGHGQKKRPTGKLGRVTVQNILNLLRCCLEAAVEKELLDANPARGLKLPKGSGATHEPWTYLLPEEQAAFLTCEAIPEEDRDLVAFALGSGLRQGEQWNLQLVDVGAERVTVRYGSKGKATKSGRIRRVPLFGLAADALARQLERLKGQPNPERLVWPLPSGCRRQKGKAPRGWQAWLTAAGLGDPAQRHDGQPVRWHDLRHSCASSLVAGWWGRRWSLEEVKGLLGHRSVTTTERYAHLADSALDAAGKGTAGPVAPAVDLPIICPEEEGAQSGNPLFTRAPPARIGRATFGLGRRSEGEDFREVEALRGLILGLSARAVQALEALATGGPSAWPTVSALLVEVAQAGAELSADGVDLASERARRAR